VTGWPCLFIPTIENANGEVDNLWGLGQLHRILAQVEDSYSNSMIEALWRTLKHGWLFLHQLDTFAALEKLIAFYVEQHNSVVPPLRLRNCTMKCLQCHNS
jgi:hypothetical protein